MLKGDNLAAALQTALRNAGSRTIVDYAGGGWFRVRRPYALGEGRKMRGEDARMFVDGLVRDSRDPREPPIDANPSTKQGWRAAMTGKPRTLVDSITGPSRGLWFSGYDAALARLAEIAKETP